MPRNEQKLKKREREREKVTFVTAHCPVNSFMVFTIFVE